MNISIQYRYDIDILNLDHQKKFGIRFHFGFISAFKKLSQKLDRYCFPSVKNTYKHRNTLKVPLKYVKYHDTLSAPFMDVKTSFKYRDVGNIYWYRDFFYFGYWYCIGIAIPQDLQV